MNRIEFHLPVRPYSPIDAHNRAAAAKGSPRYAQLTAHADYNGHHVSLAWNDHRQYYVAEYYWAGRVVLARGRFADCLRAVLQEYDRGALGSSASIYPRQDDQEALDLLRAEPRIVEGSLWANDGQERKLTHGDWWTWRHRAAAAAARDMANRRSLTLIFDWPLMEKAESRAEYEKLLQEKYGRIYQ